MKEELEDSSSGSGKHETRCRNSAGDARWDATKADGKYINWWNRGGKRGGNLEGRRGADKLP